MLVGEYPWGCWNPPTPFSCPPSTTQNFPLFFLPVPRAIHLRLSRYPSAIFLTAWTATEKDNVVLCEHLGAPANGMHGELRGAKQSRYENVFLSALFTVACKRHQPPPLAPLSLMVRNPYMITYLVTKHWIWIGNWIYLTVINRRKKYSAITNSHILQITITRPDSSMASIGVVW
jgi:hypothetical protein